MILSARAFLFDFDGTLVNSAPLHEWAFRMVLSTVSPGLLDQFDYETIKGLTTRHSFVRLGIDDVATLDWCVSAKQRIYREAVAEGHLKAFPGARSILDAVDALGAESFVVSSGSAESVQRGLDSCGLRGYLAGVITAEDAPAGKPAPAPYLACLARFELDRASSIAVEDASAGVRSAQAAGLRVIGVHNPVIASAADSYFPDFYTMKLALEGASTSMVPASA